MGEKKEALMDNCIFCKIIKGEIHARKVFEDDKVVVIEDISPAAPLHVLLIPRKHIVNSLDLEAVDDELVGHVYRIAARLVREKGFADSGFRIVSNNNAGAGQSVFHIHFHLLAGRQLGWPPG
jgi:diadenosine tetraphosphate (Ap4A) HIT family hydrolase